MFGNKNIKDRLAEILDPKFSSIMEDLITLIDEIKDEAHDEGYDEGFSDGHELGYDEGYEEGLNEDSFDD